jgi:hypothetical protein
MKSYSNDNMELLAQLLEHGPISMEEFKETFPKVARPANRLRSLVLTGALKQIEDVFWVTQKTRVMLDDHTPTVALPRRFAKEGNYDGQRFAPMRPGAEDHLRIPSLIGGQRVYRKVAA